jgi:hypothetical protein
MPLVLILERELIDPRSFDPVGDLIVFFVLLGSYIGFALLGLPVILALRRFGHLSLFNVVVLGTALGATAGQWVANLLIGSPSLSISFDPNDLLLFGLSGFAAAFVFGLIAGIRRI